MYTEQFTVNATTRYYVYVLDYTCRIFNIFPDISKY